MQREVCDGGHLPLLRFTESDVPSCSRAIALRTLDHGSERLEKLPEVNDLAAFDIEF